MFLNNIFLGARVWMWLYLLVGIIVFLIALCYYYREKIRKKYYMFRYPEKVIRIYIHYANNKFKVFYRLIPDDDFVDIRGLKYNFSNKNVLNNDSYCKYDSKQRKFVINIEDKEYNIEDNKIITLPKRENIPEIHYFYNNSNPLNFDIKSKKLDFSAKQLKDFKDNDLFTKLLTLRETDNYLKFLMLICAGNLIATLFIIAKLMEWIA